MRQKSVVRLIVEPLIAAVVLAFVVRSTVRLYAIPSGSMQPTLSAGDRIVVTPYRWDEPARGDVIVFRAPLRPSAWMVKRVVAVPGDLIDARLDRVRIGGYTIAEPYIRRQGTTTGIVPQLIASRRYYVLGDDRENSLDSRHWGTLPRHLIVGRARLVLWSSSITPDPTAQATTVANAGPARSGQQHRIFKWIE